jgi:cell division protein FtsB
MTAPAAEAPRGPRPITAFLVSFAVSAVLLGVLLISDRRVFELADGRARNRQLDAEIAEKERENRDLQAQIQAANTHEFPAEKIAREELQLVGPSDLVILYPAGSLTAKPTPAVRPADPAAGQSDPAAMPADPAAGHPER